MEGGSKKYHIFERARLLTKSPSTSRGNKFFSQKEFLKNMFVKSMILANQL